MVVLKFGSKSGSIRNPAFFQIWPKSGSDQILAESLTSCAMLENNNDVWKFCTLPVSSNPSSIANLYDHISRIMRSREHMPCKTEICSQQRQEQSESNQCLLPAHGAHLWLNQQCIKCSARFAANLARAGANTNPAKSNLRKLTLAQHCNFNGHIPVFTRLR